MLNERNPRYSRAINNAIGLGIMGATVDFGIHSSAISSYFAFLNTIVDNSSFSFSGLTGRIIGEFGGNFMTKFISDIPHLGEAALIGGATTLASAGVAKLLEKSFGRAELRVENRAVGVELERTESLSPKKKALAIAGLGVAALATPFFEEPIFRDGAANAFGYSIGSHELSLPIGLASSVIFGYCHNLAFSKGEPLFDYKYVPVAQIVTGLGLWYAYTQFGLEGSIMAHSVYNASILAAAATYGTAYALRERKKSSRP